MNVVIEHAPTHENMDYVFELQIDITQRLSAQNSLHLLGADREIKEISRDEDVFEIKIDDVIVFTKELLGRLPSGEEVVNYIINNS